MNNLHLKVNKRKNFSTIKIIRINVDYKKSRNLLKNSRKKLRKKITEQNYFPSLQVKVL
jgi:hypothetical protein